MQALDLALGFSGLLLLLIQVTRLVSANPVIMQSRPVGQASPAGRSPELHRCMRLLVGRVILFAVAGCGGGSSYPHATIHGAVTLDGKPIENGKITYFPQASAGAGSGGSVTITGGKYELAGVPIGQANFTFSALVETGRMVEDLGKQVPERVNPIPVIYREAGVGREITSSGEQNFDLFSNPAKQAGSK